MATGGWFGWWTGVRDLGECVHLFPKCVQFSAECVHFFGQCVPFFRRCVQFACPGVQCRRARAGALTSSGQAYRERDGAGDWLGGWCGLEVVARKRPVRNQPVRKVRQDRKRRVGRWGLVVRHGPPRDSGPATSASSGQAHHVRGGAGDWLGGSGQGRAAWLEAVRSGTASGWAPRATRWALRGVGEGADGFGSGDGWGGLRLEQRRVASGWSSRERLPLDALLVRGYANSYTCRGTDLAAVACPWTSRRTFSVGSRLKERSPHRWHTVAGMSSTNTYR